MCAAVLVPILYKSYTFYHDDAYITLRYAHNFIHGDGIVWNKGEYVQGYTNFLHLLLISLLGFFGCDLWLASRIISVIAFFILTSWSVIFPILFGGRDRGHPMDMISFFIISTSAPMLVWILGGLEGVLFSTLSSLGVMTLVYASRPNNNVRLILLSGIFFSFAIMTRPDGVIFAFISFIFIIILRPHKLFRTIGSFILPFLVTVLPYLIWTIVYYGDIVPNTFYVRATGFSFDRAKVGLFYLWRFSRSPPYIAILLILAIVYAVCRRRLDSSLLYIFSCIVSYMLYIVYVGGDHMQCFRLLLPVIPLSAYMVHLLLRRIISPKDKLKTIAVYSLLFVLAVGQIGAKKIIPRHEDPASSVGTIIGKHIAKYWPKNSLIALNTAGSTPYYAPNHYYIDMLGLNDRHIAKRQIDEPVLPWQRVPGHSKGDGGYVLSRRPDFIIVGPAEGTFIDKPWFLSDWQMLHDPRFTKNYVLRQVILDMNGEQTLQKGLRFIYYERRK